MRRATIKSSMGRAKQSHDAIIKTDREAFRAWATAALSRFTPDDREIAASVETDHVTADDVLRAWSEQIEPIHQDLEAKRHDSRFKKMLIRNVGFYDDEADRIIDYMIDERKALLLDEVLDSLYPFSDDTMYQREYATELLTRPDTTISDYMSRYIDFIEALDASEKHHVLLCDPHGTWLERQRAALQINKERQRIIRDEDERLDEIDEKLHHMTNDKGSLVVPIIRKGWDFATILDLRAKYQKQVDALSVSERRSPTKKLKLFERVTTHFREAEAERIAHDSKTHSLKELRTVNEDIYNLLLEIFDLDQTARNKLVLDIQNYTRLSQERDLMLLIQRNREQFLTAPSDPR